MPNQGFAAATLEPVRKPWAKVKILSKTILYWEKMNRYKQDLGAKGERLALKFLRQRGYKIITRNFSCRFGEIDVIARQEKTTVFIEVKTRSSCAFGLPQDAIKAEKIRHLWRSAQFYIKNYADPEGEFRFDVVAIVLGNEPKIYLIKDIL